MRIFFDCAKGYKLWCWIRNILITNRILIWLGFERRIQRINSTITITDENGTIISFLDYGVTSNNDIRLGIVEVKSKYDGKVFLKDERDRFGAILKVGLYTLELELQDDDRQLLMKKKYFRVNPQYPFVEWVTKT